MRGANGTTVTGRPLIRPRTAGMYSRRHIDLQRVAGALCPAYEKAAPRHTRPGVSVA